MDMSVRSLERKYAFAVLLLIAAVCAPLSALAATATVSAKLNPTAPYYTDNVSATITVNSASAPQPTGTISWSIDSTSQAAVEVTNGVARLNLKFFAPGAHSLTYSYGGDGSYSATASQTVSFSVADRPFAVAGGESAFLLRGATNAYHYTVALDSKQNLYLPDALANTISKSDPARNVTLVPTTGLNRPDGIVLDASDNIFVADSGNGRIVEITASGTQSTVPVTGLIDPVGLAFDAAYKTLYITDQGNGNVVMYNVAAKTQTSIATNLSPLCGIVPDGSGNIYVATGGGFTDQGDVYRIDSAGNITELYTGVQGPSGLLLHQGNLYIAAAGGVFELDTNGHLSQLSYERAGYEAVNGEIVASGIAMDTRGTIYYTNAGVLEALVQGPDANAGIGPTGLAPGNGATEFFVYYQVSYLQTVMPAVVPPNAPISVIAADYTGITVSPFNNVPFLWETELAVTPQVPGPFSTDVSVTDSNGVSHTALVYGVGLGSELALSPGVVTQQSVAVSSIGGMAQDSNRVTYLSDTANNKVLQLAGSTPVTVPFIGLNKPTQLAVDGAGTVYVLDSGSSRVLRVDTTGKQSVAFDLANQTALTSLQSFAIDGGGNLYLGGNSAAGGAGIYFLDQLGDQTLIAGNVALPDALAVDGYGAVYSVESGNGILRHYDRGGDATVAASSLTGPVSVAVDPSGTAYVAGAPGSGLTIVHTDGSTEQFPLPALTNASAVTVDGSGNLSVADSAGKQVYSLVRGQSIAPVNNYDFGDVTVGTTKTISNTVTNVGNLPSQTFTVYPPEPDFSWATVDNGCVFGGSSMNPSLAAGASCALELAFSPTRMGSETSDNFGVTYYFDMDATGNGVAAAAAPAISISPSSLSFPLTVAGGVSAPLTLTVTNSGGATANLKSAQLGAPQPGAFAVTDGCGYTLAPKSSCTLSVVFEPYAPSTTYNSSVTVASDDPNSPASATVTGTSSPVPAPSAALTPSSADFGSVTVGTTSATKTFTLTNAGTAALPLNVVGISGANISSFALTGNTCISSLAAGASCTISISFTPTATGTATASLTVIDSVGTQTSTLTGNGTMATPTAPAATLTPSSLNFGSVQAGTKSTAQTATLTSTGTAPLSITGIQVGGTNAAVFASTNNCGATLAVGASCTISISFTPAAAGTFSASLTVIDSVGTQTSTLTGNGTMATPTVPAATLTPSSLSFGSVQTGTKSAAQTATLTSTGTAPLAITGIQVGGTNAGVFVSTNTCGTSLAVGSSCTISVTFDPTAAGSDAATISVADNASGSPQTVALTGTATAPPPAADFTIAATPSMQTVDAGSSANYTVSLNSSGSTFTDPVTLTISGLPAGATATFTPSSVTPGTAGASSMLTVQTAVQQAALDQGKSRWPLGITVVSTALLILPFRRRKRISSLLMSVGLLLVSVVSLTACSGGFAVPSKPQPSSTTYTLTVTGASGTTQHSTTVQITVR